MSEPSIFPLQEMMLICSGCGGERLIPRDVLDAILSVDDLKRFTDGRMATYACKCGARTCDIRLLPNAAAMPALIDEVERLRRRLAETDHRGDFGAGRCKETP